MRLRRPLACLAALLAAALLAPGLPLAGGHQTRALTFEQRLQAQRALDRLEYGHLIGASRPFDDAVPMERTTARVRGTLARSAALASWWHTPITQAVLQRELERIARDTRLPGRLLEVYAALGNDPLLVREAFVRPQLVERLARDFYASDERIPEPKSSFDTWWAARAAQTPSIELPLDPDVAGPLPAPGQVAALAGNDHWDNGILDDVATQRTGHSVVWTGSEMIVWGGTTFGQFQALDTGSRYDPITNTWKAVSNVGAPSPRMNHSAVWTGSEMIVWGGESPALSTGGRYDPATDTWFPTTPLFAASARSGHTAIWTGSAMIVWGGQGASGALSTGALYVPSVDAWTPLSPTGAPAARGSHTAIWTGSEMIVWGGHDGSGPIDTGARYNPAADAWSALPMLNAPSARGEHTAVWTGSRMIVWGGEDTFGLTATGALYDPASDAWTATSTTGTPLARYEHTAVWTGSRMVVWGGTTASSTTRTGGLYDPSSNTWAATTTTNTPSSRTDHSAVWTGSIMIAFGGRFSGALNTGGRYDPAANSWTPTAVPPAASGPAVWTGSEMVVLSRPGTSGRYNLVTDTWAPVSSLNHPSSIQTAVWTGSEAITWNGGAGGRYAPATDTWTPLTTSGAPFVGRGLHSAVWTGQEMIVFGGDTGAGGFEVAPTNAGGRYNPASNSWTLTPATGAPTARAAHSAVWTGTQMIVWGGIGTFGTVDPDGKKYDPVANAWTPISTAGDPSRRYLHSALWTGHEMIVWGGTDDDSNLGDGARYDPASDTWIPISDSGAPAARVNHSSVWSGNEMLVWGGDDTASMATGGRYDPIADTWVPLSSTGAPRLSGHTAVWTGHEMIAWSGLQGGGRLTPAHDNLAPVAVITGGGSVPCSTFPGYFSFHLDGSGSFDPDGSIASSEWFEYYDFPFRVPLGTGPTYDAFVSFRNDSSRLITLRVTDADGASATSNVSVSQQDTTPPVMTCPTAPIVAECAGPVATFVPFPNITVQDDCNGGGDFIFSRTESPHNVPFASNNYVYGTTQVTYMAHPDFGPSSSCTFTVIVQDTTPPQMTCPAAVVAECGGPDSTHLALPAVTATDACSSVVTLSRSESPENVPAGSDNFVYGTTQVTWTAVPDRGPSATCNAGVTVQDTTPPALSVSTTPKSLWPANGKLKSIVSVVSASDLCGEAGYLLSEVTSSEPHPGDIVGAETGTPDLEFQLRAERDGSSVPRTYTVTYDAVDSAGLHSSVSTFVRVPLKKERVKIGPPVEP